MALISNILLCACSPSSSTSNTPVSSASSASPSSNGYAIKPVASTNALSPDSFLKKDIAYADARKALLAQGWMPEKDTDCKANMGADDAAKCDAIPELSIYSDQGVLVVHFRHGLQRLTVRSYGMLSDWEVPGENSRLRVTDWQISNAATKGNPATP